MPTVDSTAPAPTTGPTPAVRASDAEREATMARLHHALGEGRLDLNETEARVAAAYAAQYRSDLLPLLADLPQEPPPGRGDGPPTWMALWTSIVWRAGTTLSGRNGVDQPRPTATQFRIAALLATAWIVACVLLGPVVAGMVLGEVDAASSAHDPYHSHLGRGDRDLQLPDPDGVGSALQH